MSKISKIKLGKIAKFQQGLQVDVDLQFFSKKENYVQFLRIVDYTNNEEVPRYIENTKKSPSYVSQNDVVMIRYGSQTAGKVVIGKEGIIANNMFRIIPIVDNIENLYLYYFLKNQAIYNFLMNGQSSSTMPAITFGMMNDIDIYLPNIEDQQKIASVLSTLDAKIELNKKINTELEAMAKSLYDYWFVQFDFPNEQGKPYKSSGGEMVWSEELKRKIPKGWEVKKLKEVESNIITGKTPSTEISEYFNGNVPFICIGDVRGNMHIVKTELTLSKKGADIQKNKYIPKGSICVTCIASPGLVGFATEESQTNQQLNSVVCEKKENRYYLYFYLIDYFTYAKAKTGNTFANMNKDDFSSILTLKPSDKLLIDFAKKVSPLIEKILINSQENQKLAELRDFLLPMLMNGQVVVE